MSAASLSDVALLAHMLKVVNMAPQPRRALKEAKAEAKRRGPERMEAARIVLGEQREAERCMVLLSEEAANG